MYVTINVECYCILMCVFVRLLEWLNKMTYIDLQIKQLVELFLRTNLLNIADALHRRIFYEKDIYRVKRIWKGYL